MKQAVNSLFLLGCYLALIVPFTSYMSARPLAEKLGYSPQAEVLRFISADQKLFVANSLVMKTMFYFGSLVEKDPRKIAYAPDYFTMYKNLESTVKLDPYNMDAYYFAQASMVWEAGRAREVVALLEYGMHYRDWDYYLPFFAGFDCGYFLKDYPKAAAHYKRAAELTGEPLYASLAGRYMYEAGATDMALAYLIAMEKSAKNNSIRKTFQVRITAFKEVRRIDAALAAYRRDVATPAATIDLLVQKGYLQGPPVDPYGGKFFIDEKGQVRSTSKFAFAGGKRPDEAR